MRPATDQFLELVRQSHVIAAACTLIFPDGTTADVPVQAGNVRNDRTADSRRAGTIQIPWSLEAGADLGVDLRTLSLGGYAVVSRGIRYADGSTELVELGRLRVESVSVGHPGRVRESRAGRPDGAGPRRAVHRALRRRRPHARSGLH